MSYSLPIRMLHALFALGISAQMLLSLVMRQPRPGRVRGVFETLTFVAHETVGVAVLAILVVHWLLHLFGQPGKGLAHFFPWFSREGRRRVADEAGELMRLRIDEPEAQDAVAGAIQGLGLVVASILAITGGWIFLGMADDGTMPATVRSIRKVHTTLAPLMWGYLGVHIGAAMLHVALGHRSVLAIFRLRDGGKG